MQSIPEQTSLGSLSLPGTHESLSIHGGPLTQTQEDHGDHGATLAAQLNAGIRAIDVRVHVADIANNIFDIYHGPQPQSADFGEVLHVVGDFLAAHPSETVLIRLKAECTGEWQLVGSLGWQQSDPLTTCADERGTTNDVITSIFDHYRDQNAGYFWTPSVTGTGAAAMPTIGQVRGKIVVWAFDGPHGNPFGNDTDGFYGLSQLANRASRPTYIQDYYDIPTLVDIQAKWNRVQAHLVATNTDLGLDHMYVNFLSGSSAGAHPYSVAPEINFGMLEYLQEANVWRTGMLMMDFPDTKLIESVDLRQRVLPQDAGCQRHGRQADEAELCL